MRKKPWPSMARSSGLFELIMSPGWKDLVVETVRTPRPTCNAEGCPPPPAALGGPDERMVSESRSSNSARLFLKPVVLVFARLWAITSIFVCWASIPVAAVYSERNMVFPFVSFL